MCIPRTVFTFTGSDQPGLFSKKDVFFQPINSGLDDQVHRFTSRSSICKYIYIYIYIYMHVHACIAT